MIFVSEIVNLSPFSNVVLSWGLELQKIKKLLFYPDESWGDVI